MPGKTNKGWKIHFSTLQLLRFHFSFFLMPVFWFALSQVPEAATGRTLLVFAILHLLVYPSSNGYNSYMDRDTTPVGGIANPLQPTKQLFYVTIGMDVVAVTLSWLVSPYFTAGIVIYILASRAYSYRGIRLKKYAIPGYLIVILCQGALTFFLVYHGCDKLQTLDIPWEGLAASSLLIGGFYPLTQIYQHEADKADGVYTISYLLGYRGTFIFCATIYSLAMGVLAWYFFSTLQEKSLLILTIFLLPVLLYFFRWFSKVRKDISAADFQHTMRMNILASVCTNAGFITVLMINYFE